MRWFPGRSARCKGRTTTSKSPNVLLLVRFTLGLHPDIGLDPSFLSSCWVLDSSPILLKSQHVANFEAYFSYPDDMFCGQYRPSIRLHTPNTDWFWWCVRRPPGVKTLRTKDYRHIYSLFALYILVCRCTLSTVSSMNPKLASRA